jgi:lactoylglutathione lyase
MSDTMISDLGHAAFRVRDIEETLKFYELLGIRESFRLHHDDGSLMLIYLHISGDRFIEIFPGGPEDGPSGEQSFMHVCLVTDDLHGTTGHLRGSGIEIWREPKRGLDGNWQAWVKDPDGNEVELMQLAEDSPQRRAALEGERA